MAHALHPADFASYHGDDRPHEAVPGKSGILRRLYRAFHAYRQREADRQIAAFVARSGGRFTDEFERELSARVATGDWDRRWPPSRI
jgi:hypothetical protein